MEHSTQYHHMMRPNEAGHEVKMASSVTEARRRSQLSSIVELDMSADKSPDAPLALRDSVQKLSVSAIESIEQSP